MFLVMVCMSPHNHYVPCNGVYWCVCLTVFLAINGMYVSWGNVSLFGHMFCLSLGKNRSCPLTTRKQVPGQLFRPSSIPSILQIHSACCKRNVLLSPYPDVVWAWPSSVYGCGHQYVGVSEPEVPETVLDTCIWPCYMSATWCLSLGPLTRHTHTGNMADFKAHARWKHG